MTETEKLAQAVELAFKTFSEYADLHRAKGTRDGDAKADRNADLAATMHEALTAWNTRPDEEEPAAHRRRSKNLRWEYRDDGSTSVAVTDWLPLYTRPAPALGREGVARLIAMADVAAGYPADDEDQSFDAQVGRAFIAQRNAILAMVGGGVPAGWQDIANMPVNTRVLVWVDEKHMHGVHFGSAYRRQDGTLVARPEGCNGDPWRLTHWMPLPDAPASTVEG